MTEYGDAIEDEWLVVYILRELSRRFENIWVRVADGGGEFLLVEAAQALPRWLSPEMDRNRVWIHQGQLRIIKPAATSPTPSRELTLAEAVQALHLSVEAEAGSVATASKASDMGTVIHSPVIEAEAFYRLEKYPGQIANSLHHALATVPRRLAYVLHLRPRAVAPAVAEFLLSEAAPAPVMKQLRDGRPAPYFPLDDLVTVSVRLTKILFAQLRAQRNRAPFRLPVEWQKALVESEGLPPPPFVPTGTPAATSTAAEKPPDTDAMATRIELGAQLTTGFELLARAAAAGRTNNRVAREMVVLLEDLEGDDADRLPTDEEMRAWPDVARQDDEAWMDIDFDALDRELQGRGREQRSAATEKEEGRGQGTARSEPRVVGAGGDAVAQPGARRATAAGPVVSSRSVPGGASTADKETVTGFGDAAVHADLKKIVSRFEAFLNDETAGPEGAEWEDEEEDDDDDYDEEDDESGEEEGGLHEDKNASFDEEEFAKLMREMMGLPPREAVGGGRKGYRTRRERDLWRAREALGLNSDDEDDDGSGDDGGGKKAAGEGSAEQSADEAEAIRKLSEEMEAELRGLGALKLGDGTKRKMKKQAAIQDAGPASSTKGKEVARKPASEDEEDEDMASSNDDEELDIDYNLAKNLLESFKSQAGDAGPAGNLLGMLGLQLPRDEGDSEDDETAK